MKNFLKFTLASCLGVFLAMVVMSIFSILIVGAFVGSASSSSSAGAEVKKNSLLKLSFNEKIPEHTNNTSNMAFDFENPDVVGLHDIIDLIDQARTDDKIAGLYIEGDNLSLGISGARLIREAIDSFKLSGKPVVAQADGYSQMSYYVASAADHVMLSPTGWMDFRGFGTINTYIKESLDALGIQMEVYYAGDYKSATETFRRTNMSDENREQTRAFINDLYSVYLTDLSHSRDISVAKLRGLSQNLKHFDPKVMLDAGMVDELGYQMDALEFMKEKLELEEDDKMYFSSIGNYYKSYKIITGW